MCLLVRFTGGGRRILYVLHKSAKIYDFNHISFPCKTKIIKYLHNFYILKVLVIPHGYGLLVADASTKLLSRKRQGRTEQIRVHTPLSLFPRLHFSRPQMMPRQRTPTEKSDWRFFTFYLSLMQLLNSPGDHQTWKWETPCKLRQVLV